jgi:TatD DNase family protein
MPLIDSHTHLDSFARRGELPAVLQRARDAGLEAMIAIGTAPDDWSLYREIARVNPGFVHYAVGLHPCSVEADWAGAVAQIETFWKSGTGVPPVGSGRDARATRPVALGECGLDRFHLPKEPAEADKIFGWQKAAFAAQLDRAAAGLPVVIHSRGAFASAWR